MQLRLNLCSHFIILKGNVAVYKIKIFAMLSILIRNNNASLQTGS